MAAMRVPCLPWGDVLLLVDSFDGDGKLRIANELDTNAELNHLAKKPDEVSPSPSRPITLVLPHEVGKALAAEAPPIQASGSTRSRATTIASIAFTSSN